MIFEDTGVISAIDALCHEKEEPVRGVGKASDLYHLLALTTME